MTAPLTTEQIQQLRSMERKLLGERPRAALAAADDSRPPWLIGRRGPAALFGWLRTAPAKSMPDPVSAAKAAAMSWPEKFPNPEDALRRRFVEHQLRLSVHDRDAPVLVVSAHKAHPSWDRARIGRSLGLPDWLVSLILAKMCKAHSHGPAEGASPAAGAASDSGWRLHGDWLIRMVVGKSTRR